MRAVEHLPEYLWTHPNSYAGYEPDGEYVIATRTRDSNNLELSNWDAMRRIAEESGAGDSVYDWRASHCMVGWVEYLMLKPDAPEECLTAVAEALCVLADYPILDEYDYSEREYIAIYEYWERCSTKERVEYCQEAGISIFAARRDEMPEGVFDSLRDSGVFA